MSVNTFLGLVLITIFCSNTMAINDLQPIEVGQKLVVQSLILNEKRVLNIYLPVGYEKSKENYPVLYLLDGGIHEDFLHIMGLATLAADYRKIEPFILVGIEGIDRYHDLTSPSSNERDRKELPTHGGANKFRQYIEKEVFAEVDKRLRTNDRKVLMGESLAGHFVLETFINTPLLFSSYIAISPSLWWNIASLTNDAKKVIPHRDHQGPIKLFLSIANEGGKMRESLEKWVEVLKNTKNRNLNWRYSPRANETHATIFHPAAFEAIRWVFRLNSTKH